MSIRQCMISAACCFLSAAVWAAPTLSLGNSSAKPNTDVVLSLMFDPGGAAVSAAQCSLVLPTGVTFVSATTGPAAASAGKSAEAKSNGKDWNIIVMGMNQNKITQGVVATITVHVAAGVKGTMHIPVRNVVYSDPSGRAVKSGQIRPGTVQIAAKS